MNEKRFKNLLFWFYAAAILILAIVYFTVPERALLLNNVTDWWSGVFKF